MKKLFVLWAFLALPSYLAATTYYVDVAGSDAAAGTQAAPWKTLSKVNATSFTAGDVVHLNAGTFGAVQNDTTLVIPSSGTAGATTFFEGAGANLTTITAAAPKSLWGAGTGWEPFGAVAKTYYHLLAKDDSVYSGWKQTTGANDSILTRVMTATPTTHQRFCVRTAAGATLDTLVVFMNAAADTTNITRSKAFGINNTKHYITIRNLRVTKGTGGNAASFTSSNIYTTGQNFTLTRCMIDSSNYQGVSPLSALTKVYEISYCVFKYNVSYAINAFYEGGTIHNNTFIGGNDQVVIQAGTLLSLKNNIYYDPILRAVYLSTAAVTYVASNNLYYDTSYTNKWRRGATTFSTLASWADSTGQEANSLTGDPLFVSTTLDDYRLTRLSPAYRAGVDVGLTSDFAGKSIIQPPEIGAYEFHPTLFNRVFFGDWK